MAEMENTSNEKTSKKRVKSILKKQDREKTLLSDKEINDSMDMLAASAMNYQTEGNVDEEMKPGKRKKRTKEEKNSALEEGNKNQKEKSRKMALSYLKCWKKQREEWKFQKVRQTWLLKHMYDTSLVPERSFKILLEYLEQLKGQSRELTIQRAQTILEQQNQDEETSNRADQLLKILV